MDQAICNLQRRELALSGTAKRLVVVWAIVLGIAALSGAVPTNASCPKVGFTLVEPHATLQTRELKTGSHGDLFVHRVPLTSTRDITDIKLVKPRDGDDDDVTIQMKFTRTADQRLHDATTNHSGLHIAFLFDDYVLNDVVWRGPYGIDLGGVSISVAHGLKPALKLMKAIQGCTAATAGEATYG